ncbi:protein-disulfide reductase DsbD [Photobacterium sp. MCCC 1A19761]|uniref:protein-disulfide reductase DsbD n=1 Tax=Photobacterium sp. MCCC 1A19761 TaxID=3115000 RepID=UPI00307DC32D
MISPAAQWLVGLFLTLCMSLTAWASDEKTFLPVEQAFPFSYHQQAGPDGGELVVQFDTAAGYYLYHKRFSFKAVDETLELGEPRYALTPEQQQDPNFGLVKVYHEPLSITIPYRGEGTAKVRFQGCADDGLCYLPQTKKLALNAASAPAQPQSQVSARPVALENNLAQQNSLALETDLAQDTQGLSAVLQNASFLQAMGLFFLLGLGLSLTPCVLPMIPILSSIIGGQGESMSGWKGFRISLAYVLGMASSYALAGVVTATMGQGLNLQTAMQQTWVLSLFAALFVVLSLAMFGLYELQLPSRLQVALNSQSQRLSGGKALTVFVMGAVSALVVSPCVSAPLAGALLYVSTTQDWVVGGTSLFVLALGMGVPLVVIGTSGGKFLPRSGPWMIAVKHLFGVMLLAVAILLVSRFAAAWVTLGLWAALLIGSAIHFGALEAAQSGWQRTRKSLAFVSLVYGVMLFIGMMTGAEDPFDPLSQLGGGGQPAAAAQVSPFQKTTSVETLVAGIKAAPAGQITMVDLYADWCASCKVMDRTVFRDPQVRDLLAQLNAHKLDVTANTEAQAAWLAEYQLFGPPAILFFDSEGQELDQHRVVGEMDTAQFLAHVQGVVTQG